MDESITYLHSHWHHWRNHAMKKWLFPWRLWLPVWEGRCRSHDTKMIYLACEWASCVFAAWSAGWCHHWQRWHEDQTDTYAVWSNDHYWWAAARRYWPHHQHHWHTGPDSECTVPSADEVQHDNWFITCLFKINSNSVWCLILEQQIRNIV